MKMEFVDSHAHLDYDKYDEDRDAMLARAEEAGIKNILQIAMGPSEEKIVQCYQLVKKHDHMRMAVGIHPHDADKFDDDVYHTVLTYASKEKVSAIGEIGLDYYYENSNREKQKNCFSQLMDLAVIMNLPICVHTRDAFDDTYALTKEKDIFRQVGGVIHCFTGTEEEAKKFVELGAYISFSGVVTFKNTEELHRAVKAVPMDRILIETDAPFLAPVPYRGKRNEPAYMLETAKTVAAIKGVSLEEIARVTTINARKLFKFS